MKAFLLITLLFLNLGLRAQSVSGFILDENQNGLPGANVYIENTFVGGSTDSIGFFSFSYDKADSSYLMVEFIGFESARLLLNKEKNHEIKIALKEKFNLLNAVTISAGSYSSGKVESKVVMTSLDVVTTAGSLGDINAAMRSLPGTSNNGESGKLFVHGGEGSETGTYIDGIYVHQPYTSSAPNMAVRGRFNPFMFSGTSFSTGGYSAEYGQALSSVLTLNTNDIPNEEQLDLSIMTIGGDVSGTKKWEQGAITASVNYMNLKPYMSIIPQNYEWKQEPTAMGGSLSFRQKTKGHGMLKVYASADQSNLAHFSNTNDQAQQGVEVQNKNQFINTNWKGSLSPQLLMTIGGSYTHNVDDYTMEHTALSQKLVGNHLKSTLKYYLNEKTHFRGGLENTYTEFIQYFSINTNPNDSSSSYSDNLSAAFVEAQVYLSNRLLFNAGLRAERSSYLDYSSLAPRFSMAFKIAEKSSLSLAYGVFYQNPSNEQLLHRSFLNNERADHLILSFERSFEDRILRSEIYYKKYQDLVKYDRPFNNSGTGYAYGFDAFYKDSKSIKNATFWISYSFLKTERDFKNYPYLTTPDFAVSHSLTLVYKHWIDKWRSYIGASMRYASPRVYNDPNLNTFNGAELPAYTSLDLNWSYLHKQNVIFYASVSNVLGYENVYGYQYSPIPNDQGYYQSTAILPAAKRFIFLGCFITITKKGEANQLDKINF